MKIGKYYIYDADSQNEQVISKLYSELNLIIDTEKLNLRIREKCVLYFDTL